MYMYFKFEKEENTQHVKIVFFLVPLCSNNEKEEKTVQGTDETPGLL